MSAADDAFQYAKNEIAKAKAEGWDKLNLGVADTRALEILPAEIAGLTSLTLLNLSNTQISDATPLAGLTSLKRLYLNNTQISDATPLAGLTSLKRLNLNITQISDLRELRSLIRFVEDTSFIGLTFKNTAATRLDPEIAKISEIEDGKTRAETLFKYLETWVPPEEWVAKDSKAAPSFVLPEGQPMRSKQVMPDKAEDDSDQRGLQQDLQTKIHNLLAVLQGVNDYGAIGDAAAHYRDRIAAPLLEIPLTLLYSAANTLRTEYEAHLAAEKAGRENDCLPPKIEAPLKDVVEIHALFFAGFAKGAEIHQKMLSGLTGQRAPEQVALADPLVKSLEQAPKALEPDDQAAMADDLAAAKGSGPSAEIGEIRLLGRIGNMLGAFGRKVLATGVIVVAGHYFLQWVLGNEAMILAWLQSVYGAGAGWFARALEIIKSFPKP